RLRFVCPHIPLAGSYQEYLQGLGRRENLRRREKWLFRQPGVSIEVARTPEEARIAVERFLELHRARWAVEGGSDGLADARHEVALRRGNEADKAQGARAERWTIQMRLWRGSRGKAVRAAQQAALFARESVKAALPRMALEVARRTRRMLRAPRPEGMGRLEALLRASAQS